MRVPAQFVPELGGAFGFSESELAANAEGRMTGKQRLRLLANGFWYWLFLAFIAVMTAAVAIRTAMVLANGFGPVVVLLVGILLLFALALGLVWRWALRSGAGARATPADELRLRHRGLFVRPRSHGHRTCHRTCRRADRHARSDIHRRGRSLRAGGCAALCPRHPVGH